MLLLASNLVAAHTLAAGNLLWRKVSTGSARGLDDFCQTAGLNFSFHSVTVTTSRPFMLHGTANEGNDWLDRVAVFRSVSGCVSSRDPGRSQDQNLHRGPTHQNRKSERPERRLTGFHLFMSCFLGPIAANSNI